MKHLVSRSVRRFVTTPVQRAFAIPAPKVVRGALATPVLVGVALTFAGVSPSFAAPVPAAANPAPASAIAGARLFVNPESLARGAADKARNKSDAELLSRMAEQPGAVWFGEWSGDPKSSVDRVVSAATRQKALAVLVAYNIPNRDCGSYSAGGADSAEKYRNWINSFASGLKGRRAVVILEPDALAGMSCMNAKQQQDRVNLLSDAVTALKKNGAAVYIDAGNPTWHDAGAIANRLKLVGIDRADGFALNVSNFMTTSQNVAYGEKISKLTGGKHFVIDTSRNGNGGNGQWCNPRGRALGQLPTTRTGHDLVDAYLWVKRPGESDGTCNGGPKAGQFWSEYALELARNSQSVALR